MAGLTKGSKEMLTLKNKFLIEYAIDEALEAGAEKIGVVINQSKKDLGSFLRKKISEKYPIEIIYREPKGIMDALLSVKYFVNGEPFCVILPDMIYLDKPNAIQKLISCFKNRKKGIMIGLFKESKDFNDCYPYAEFEKNGEIVAVKNITRNSKEKIRFFGRYIFPPTIFEEIENIPLQDSEKPIIDEAIKRKSLFGVILNENAFDLGTPERFIFAKKVLEN